MHPLGAPAAPSPNNFSHFDHSTKAGLANPTPACCNLPQLALDWLHACGLATPPLRVILRCRGCLGGEGCAGAVWLPPHQRIPRFCCPAALLAGPYLYLRSCSRVGCQRPNRGRGGSVSWAVVRALALAIACMLAPLHVLAPMCVSNATASRCCCFVRGSSSESPA